jgi:hypothetical protein
MKIEVLLLKKDGLLIISNNEDIKEKILHEGFTAKDFFV